MRSLCFLDFCLKRVCEFLGLPYLCLVGFLIYSIWYNMAAKYEESFFSHTQKKRSRLVLGHFYYDIITYDCRECC